jgi:DNA repair exonuclease SbcCD ATPase subunit
MDKLDSANADLDSLRRQLKFAEQALLILQKVSKQTQEQLEYRISELVTLALASVFNNPYEFRVIYETKRNKTEARLWFQRGDELVHPLDASGGGAVDVASFALRVALWSLATDKTDPVLILDEPFKHLSADLQAKAGQMVKEISTKLGIQIIMVSHIDQLVSEADRIFKTTLINGVTAVEEV